jgi:hypothetical protein
MDRSRAEAFRVLGIPASSDQDAVVHAYRTLARATHPDLSNDPDAADRFATVAAAYRLVSQGPPTTSISVRVREPGPRYGDWAGGQVRAVDGVVWGAPVVGRRVTPLRGRHQARAPIVAGPAWVTPSRGPDDREVRGG